MKIHPVPCSLKIFPVIIALLFNAGCAADTSYLKPQKQPPPEEVGARDSGSRPSSITSKQEITVPAAIEEKKGTSAPARVQEEEKQEIAVLPEVEEEARIAPSATIEEEQEVAALAKIEGAEKIATPPEMEEKQETPGLGKVEEQQHVVAPAKVEEKKKTAAPVRAEEIKIAIPSKIEENQDVAALPEVGQEEEKIAAPAEIGEKQEIAALPRVDEEQKIAPSAKAEEGSSPVSEAPNDSPLPPSPEIQKKSDQEMLDSALEFCQASYDFWEQGDLSNAIDALDQAYSLILKVNSNHDPEILQQREDLRFTISKRIIECYSSRFTVANGYHKAIPLVMNRHVEKALRVFKGKERAFFLNAYRLSGRYRPAIIRALKEAGLPEELSWLPLIESGFKVRAFSRSRALGLWQFIASTGYKFGLKRDYWIDERMDPEKSTMAAIAYLKELHRIFGDWTTALAAYNCGEGTVLKCIRTQRINYLDHFWDLYEKLPGETAFYVPKFLAVLHILNDPESHGFILPPVEEEIETEEVTIDKQVHLRTMAKHLGMSYEVLKDLNPALRRNATPNRPYAFKVPKGKGAVLLSNLGDIPVWRPPVPVYVRHRVRRGESLSVIARRYRTSVRAIMALNGLNSSHFIRAGRRLKIPTRGAYRPPMKSPLSVPNSKVKGNLIEYIVRKGDSLWRIADRFGTTTKAIQSMNRLDDTHLRIGQVLLIPTGVTALKKMKTKTYIVLQGDSPYIIAQKYQMNLSEFLRLNHLTPRSTIFPGQVLLVKAE